MAHSAPSVDFRTRLQEWIPKLVLSPSLAAMTVSVVPLPQQAHPLPPSMTTTMVVVISMILPMISTMLSMIYTVHLLHNWMRMMMRVI